MKDYYLKFDSEQQAISVLYEALTRTVFDGEDSKEIPQLDEEGKQIYRSHFRNISVIGTIYTGGEWDAEGSVITEPVALDGWHINVRCLDDEDASLIEPFAVEVNSPMRVWG